MASKHPEIVDTNVILRFLVGDNKQQQQKAKKWFREAQQGKRKLVIEPVVVAEACFVLESFYQKSREEIASAFEVFLSQSWLKVEERKALLLLWDKYRQGLHFVDSYLYARAQTTHSSLLSFDQKLARLFSFPS